MNEDIKEIYIKNVEGYADLRKYYDKPTPGTVSDLIIEAYQSGLKRGLEIGNVRTESEESA